MALRNATGNFLGTVGLIVALGCSYAQGDGEIELRIEAYNQGTSAAIFLYATGSGSTNFLLQSSADLNGWTNIYHSYGTPKGSPIPGWAYSSHNSQPRSFWRALPGEPLELRKQRWLEDQPTEYTFQLRHLRDFWSGGVRGKVRVRAGVIIDVTDAIDDQTEQPIENPNWSDFATIAEIFGEMERVVGAGAEQVKVVYDAGELYPIRVVVDWLVGVADDESVFQIDDFTIVEP